MSAAFELLAELRSRGGHIRAEGDRLLISPRSALSPGLVERIRQAKPQVLELLRSAPTDFTIASGAAKPAEPEPEYARPSSAEERRELGDRFLCDERIHFATFDSPVGAFLIVRDARALEALDEEHAALPVLYINELERSAQNLGAAGLRALLAARSAFGTAVELRRVRGSRRDG
jgi:hypothetical protein